MPTVKPEPVAKRKAEAEAESEPESDAVEPSSADGDAGVPESDDMEADGDEEAVLAARREAGPSAGPRAPAFFRRGTIKEVELKDFMTFSHVILRPGPKLNMVLAPNGTGKSSFVSALCVGLNGGQKLVGRGDSIKDFVRRGASSFETKITLSAGGRGRDYVVRRIVTLRRERDAEGMEQLRYDSKWQLNGRDTTSKEVDKLVAELNIQFDNLCQFLPQDRVQEFSSMNEYQLLAATEKALGDSTLHDMHQQLCTMRNEEKQEAADNTTTTARLEKLQAEHMRQRREYESYQRREELLAEARTLRRHAQWIGVHAKDKAAEAAKQRLEQRKGELQELQARQQEDTRPIRELEETIKRLRSQLQAASRTQRDADTNTKQLARNLQQHDVAVEALAERLNSLAGEAQIRARKIAAARQQCDTAKANLDAVPQSAPQAQKDRIAELSGLLREHEARRAMLGVQRSQLDDEDHQLGVAMGRVDQDLSRLNSRKQQLLNRLAQRFRNVDRVYAWVEQHRHDGTFRGPVLGPIALEMAVEASVAGMAPAAVLQAVESACFHWLPCFIVSCEEDERLLQSQVAQMQAVQVKVGCSKHPFDQPYEVPHPAGDAHKYSQYGITHTLDEVISAPPSVMFCLVHMCHVNSTYLGSRQAVDNVDRIAKETPVPIVMSHGFTHRVLRSAYQPGASTIEQKQQYPMVVLGVGGGSQEDEERRACEEQWHTLNQERTALHQRREALNKQAQADEDQASTWRDEKAQLDAAGKALSDRRVQARSALQSAERALRQAEAEPDPESLRPQLGEQLRVKAAEHVGLCKQLLAAYRAAFVAARQHTAKDLRLKEASAQLVALRASVDARKVELRAAENAVEDAERVYQNAQQERRRAREHANDNHELEEGDAAEIKRLVEEKARPDQLVSQAEEKESEAEKVVCSNQNVVNEFRRRQAQIDELTKALAEQEEKLRDLRTRLESLNGQWLPEIKRMVATVNDKFAQHFARLACCGEVRLRESEDFDKYAVELLVKFRAEEPMRLLDRHGHSGGERSVTTMLYIMALQGVTETPFRLVDEINQGMDQRNERMVFNLLVACSAESDTQCFMLSPKLLTDLEWTRDVVPVFIVNGAVGSGVADVFKQNVNLYGQD